ncbi:MAG: GGDEF domain-containing response regulator [Nitrospirae bacterium]|nr:GGDEF domain-containing response regulator [Nitrospirota bacterium]MCL5422026.1 GGDEF domain-containing response regulator [Nitrospirota bacterium]
MNKGNYVLIVDDEETLLSMLKETFTSEGYECETATSAESALEHISNTPFDIMLTDISLPGMKGFELTVQARKMRPEMAVIIMTGYIDDFSYDSAIEAGASDFIKKPFTLKELKARIGLMKVQEKQRVMSITDELTGLYNRRGFFTLAEQRLKLAKRQRRGIFMLYADVDGLKAINDTLGHQEGDMALVDTANLLKATYRESDIIARIGGDEFVVIPVGSAGDDIEIITARLQKNLDHHNATEHRNYTLSISIGIAYYDTENPSSIDELLAAGDRLMYEQKKIKRGVSSGNNH